jgi:hypothetical protein
MRAASKVDFGRYVIAKRLDFQVCDQAEGGVAAPIEIWWWPHTRSKRPLSQADKRIISLPCAVLARLSQLAPNNPPGGRFSGMGSCKVGTTGAAVISISEYHPTWAFGAVDQAG